MSDLHQLSYHTFTRTFDTQSGEIYLSQAKKTWRRRNELLVDPEPIVLIDLARWREERGNEAIEWSNASISYFLAHHPSTRIQLPSVDWVTPLTTTSLSAAHSLGNSASVIEESISTAVHASAHLVSQGVTRTRNTLYTSSEFLAHSTLKTARFTGSMVAQSVQTTGKAAWWTLSLPLSLAKVSANVVIGTAAWSWGVGESTLHLLGSLVPSKDTLATLSRWSSHAAMSFSVALMLLFAGPVVVIQTQDLLAKATQSIPQVQLPFLAAEPLPEAIPSPEPTPTPVPEINSAEDIFSISVPELNIHSTITPNVDPGNEKEYTAALKKGIAHAAGTALPEQYDFTKTVYLFAHSTDAPWNIARYNAQFYGLKDAKPGQEITVRFWGKDYKYVIESTEIIDAKDVTHLQPQLEEERLVLQTCYPPGTTWKRLLVIARPAQNTQK